jgi:hypothetical protein
MFICFEAFGSIDAREYLWILQENPRAEGVEGFVLP